MIAYANLQIALGIVLAWTFAWPIVKAGKEGPRYILPVIKEPAEIAAIMVALLAIAAVPIAFVSDRLNGWAALGAFAIAGPWADGPVWRFLLETDRLPLLWLAGAGGCVLLVSGYIALM